MRSCQCGADALTWCSTKKSPVGALKCCQGAAFSLFPALNLPPGGFCSATCCSFVEAVTPEILKKL